MRVTLAFLAAIHGGTPCLAQTTAPGFRLYGGSRQSATQLVDVHGNVVQSWPSRFQPSPGRALHLLPDGSLLRTERTTARQHPFLWTLGKITRVALDGKVLWDFDYQGSNYITHHGIVALPNGNVILTVYDELTPTEAAAVGRDPATVSSVFRPERLVEIKPTGLKTGVVVWEWRVIDHVIQDRDSKLANHGNVAAHPELVDIHYPADNRSQDWIHCNGIAHDPAHDLIVFSAPRQGEIWVIDHSTTTMEARGHTGGRWGKGGDLLYRWGNPEAYRKGTAAIRQLDGQHDPRFVPAGYPGAGNITIFNNRQTNNSSAVLEIVPPRDANGNFVIGANGVYGPAAPVWTYTASGFFSRDQGSAQRLPNGNTLIDSALQARIFEVTPNRTTVWQKQETLRTFGAPFHAHYVSDTLFADARTVSASTGFSVNLEAIAGTKHSGQNYWMLLSATGTKPGIRIGQFVLPLNYDGLTELTIVSANSTMFRNTQGKLNASGRATGTFALPPLSLPSTLELNWAYLTWDMTWTWTSNVAPLTIQP